MRVLRSLAKETLSLFTSKSFFTVRKHLIHFFTVRKHLLKISKAKYILEHFFSQAVIFDYSQSSKDKTKADKCFWAKRKTSIMQLNLLCIML